MFDITRQKLTFLLATAVTLVAAACGQRRPEASAAVAVISLIYAPGLGELMSLQQMRHTKLWLAGQAGNWELASYELDELGEGFEDVLKFHPTHKDSPVAPKDAIPRMITQPLADLQAAVNKQDSGAFARTYDALTAACNNCHQATNFVFNRVQRPQTNPYPNQVFARPKG